MVGCFGEHGVTFYFLGLAPFTDWWKCRLHHWACCHLPFSELNVACPFLDFNYLLFVEVFVFILVCVMCVPACLFSLTHISLPLCVAGSA